MADSGKRTTIEIENDPIFLDELSEFLEILGSPVRLRILKSIEHLPKDIRALSRETGSSYENTKKHVDRLLIAGVIRREAGVNNPSSRGSHLVWKYSLFPGGIEGIVRDLNIFSSLNISIVDTALADRVREVRELLSEEFSGPVSSLVLIGGIGDGTVYPLSEEKTRIGRKDPDSMEDFSSHIMVSSAYGAVTRITRPHALLSFKDGEYLIEDCESSGGTYINGVALVQNNRRVLKDGDIIDLGKGARSAKLIVVLQ
ncbi:MAG: FHA domain-containing protein [Methanomicrobiaceae archaeon]|nr:FHA domain-containing protein [Methanomicrobiaceae archaeon]